MRAVAAVVIGASLLCGAAAHAATINTAQLGLSPLFSGGDGPKNPIVSQEGHIFLGDATTGGLPSSPLVPSGSAQVDLDDGYIKMFGSAFAAMNSVAIGIFRDDVTFTKAGLTTGTFINVTFSVKLDGLLQPGQNTSQASYSLGVDLNGGAYDISKAGHFPSADLGGAFVGDPFGTYTATVQVQVGFAQPLSVELDGAAQASCNFTTCGDADFFLNNSLYWAGISSITDTNGVEIDGVSATGATGINWLNSFVPAAVPAPATLLLFGAGLAGVGAARRRR